MVRLLFTVLLVILLSSCNQKCSDQLLDITATEIFPFDNSGFKPYHEIIQSSDTTISAKVFGIYLSKVDSVVSADIRNVECIESTYKRYLNSISITANKDFDSLHKAGVSLNDYFLISGSEYDLAKPIAASQAIIERGAFGLLLVKSPVLDSVYKFSITATLSDNSILRSNTKSIKLLP